MYKGLTLCIALEDHELSSQVRRAAEAMHFRTRVVYTVQQYMATCSGADILLLGIRLANGQAQLCMDQWVAKNQGPVCILGDGIDHENENELLACGAWNVLTPPYSLEAIQAAIYRYGVVALQAKKVELLEKRQASLAKSQLVLLLLVAALAADTVVPFLLDLVKGWF